MKFFTYHLNNIQLIKSISLLTIATFIMLLTACTKDNKESKEYTKFNITIDRIVDGDTIDVFFPGEVKKKRIRFLGIQAMEMHPYQNDCWANEATQRLKELTGGKGAIVTFRVNDSEVEIKNRLARHVFVMLNGEEINLSEKLLSEGLVFPFLHFTETTYNQAYMRAAEKAKKKHLGLWGLENYCPTQADSYDVEFDMKVKIDALGYDKKNLKGEWVKLTNKSGRKVDISGWWLRDSALNFFRFPEDTIIEDNKEIIVYGGKGKQKDNIYYWGNKKPIFDNHAEGIYLHDYLDGTDVDDEFLPKGNIKASYLYFKI